MTLETYLNDLGTYLQTNSIGTLGTDIFYYGLDSVVNCISITPYAGSNPNWIISGEDNLHQPNVSVLVRNSSASAALTKANLIYRLLRNVSNLTIGSTKFLLVTPTSAPGFVSQTDGTAFIFSVNFSLLIQ